MDAEGETGSWDDFLGGRVKLYQTQSGYRATSDAVLLAAAAYPKKNDRILDVGCGTGAVSLCLHYRAPQTFITGIDIQDEMVALMEKNIAFNKKSDFIRVIKANVNEKRNDIPHNTFDWVVTNPPFMPEDQVSPNALKDKAHRENDCPLELWIRDCLKFLKPEGYFAMINRADRLPEILSILYPLLGKIETTPVFTKQNRPAKRVIVTGRKNSKAPAVLNKGIVLNDENGNRTFTARALMRDGAGIRDFL